MKLLLPLLLLACSGDDDGTKTDGPVTDGPTDSDTGTTPTDPTGETGTVPTDCTVDASVASLPDGTHGVHAVATVAPAAAATLTCTLVEAAPHWVQVLPFQSAWRVLDDGSQASADWTDSAYDDAGWTSSEAPFGLHPFVTSPLTAPALGQAALGRTTFSIDDPSVVTQLRLTAGRDDGLVVWLNGTEVARDNVPAGAWASNLPASSSIELDPLASIAVDLDASLLVAGENTLAIALHQAPPQADAYFDANLAVRLAGTDPEEVHVVAAADASTDHSLQAFGLLAESTYSCVVEAPCGASEPVEITTPGLAYDEPIFAPRPSNPAPASGAYTLINHARLCGGDKQNRLMVLDPLGRVRWSYDIAGLDQTSTIDLESTHLGDGRFLYGGGEQVAGRPAIVTLDHTEEHRADFPEAQTTPFHHDIEWHDGEVLGIFQSEVVDGPAVRDGFDLVQYDTTTQQVTWWWSTQDAYDAGQTPPTAGQVADPWHANAIASATDALGEGVYVSLLRDHSVVRIDRATDEISWRLARDGDFTLVDPAGTPLGPEAWFDGVHSVDVWGDRVFVYDNGEDKEETSAMEFSLDTDTMEATLHWRFTEPNWYDPHWGDADLLPSDDVLVLISPTCVEGNVLHHGAILEVDPATNEVGWRLDYLDRTDSSYRAERIDGCDLFANQAYCDGGAQ